MDPEVVKPQKPYNPTNELAKERNRAAAERTINSWIGNCLSLVGIGIAIDQVTQAIHERFPEKDPMMSLETARWISIFFMSSGIVLLAIALLQHQIQVQSITQENYVSLSVRSLNRVAVSAILVFSTIGIFVILLSL
jgi:putative membrane protein